MSGWKLVTIVSKLVYFTYLWDLQATFVGVIVHLLSTMDISVPSLKLPYHWYITSKYLVRRWFEPRKKNFSGDVWRFNHLNRHLMVFRCLRISPEKKRLSVTSKWWRQLKTCVQMISEFSLFIPAILACARALGWVTPPKFNMEPENDGFQIRNLLFQGAMFRWTMLNFRGVIAFRGFVFKLVKDVWQKPLQGSIVFHLHLRTKTCRN